MECKVGHTHTYFVWMISGSERERWGIRNPGIQDSKGYQRLVFVAGTIGGDGLLEAIGGVEENVSKKAVQKSGPDQNVVTYLTSLSYYSIYIFLTTKYYLYILIIFALVHLFICN